MPEIDVDISVGPVEIISVLDTTVTERLTAGKLALAGWSLRTTSVQTSLQVEGNQNAPGAGTTIATLALPAGEWVITWGVEVSGTVAAAEINNFQLLQAATPLLNSANGNGVGNVYQQPPVIVSIPVGGANVLVKNINAATAASVYSASIAASPVGAAASAEITSGNNPIAEITIPVGGSDTKWFGSRGVEVRSDVTLTVLSGSFRGAVYVVQY